MFKISSLSYLEAESKFHIDSFRQIEISFLRSALEGYGLRLVERLSETSYATYFDDKSFSFNKAGVSLVQKSFADYGVRIKYRLAETDVLRRHREIEIKATDGDFDYANSLIWCHPALQPILEKICPCQNNFMEFLMQLEVTPFTTAKLERRYFQVEALNWEDRTNAAECLVAISLDTVTQEGQGQEFTSFCELEVEAMHWSDHWKPLVNPLLDALRSHGFSEHLESKSTLIANDILGGAR